MTEDSDKPKKKRPVPRSTMMIVNRVQQGEDSAWQRLTEKVLEETRKFFRKEKLPPTWEIEDIAQLVNVSAFRSIAKFDFAEPDSFRKWVRVILRNRTTDLWRKLRADKRKGEPVATGQDDDLEERAREIEDPTAYSPLVMVESKEAEERREFAESGLSERHRTVLTLRNAGASYQEIAEQLELDRGAPAARLLYHYAQKQLAKRMRTYIDQRF